MKQYTYHSIIIVCLPFFYYHDYLSINITILNNGKREIPGINKYAKKKKKVICRILLGGVVLW